MSSDFLATIEAFCITYGAFLVGIKTSQSSLFTSFSLPRGCLSILPMIIGVRHPDLSSGLVQLRASRKEGFYFAVMTANVPPHTFSPKRQGRQPARQTFNGVDGHTTLSTRWILICRMYDCSQCDIRCNAIGSCKYGCLSRSLECVGVN